MELRGTKSMARRWRVQGAQHEEGCVLKAETEHDGLPSRCGEGGIERIRLLEAYKGGAHDKLGYICYGSNGDCVAGQNAATNTGDVKHDVVAADTGDDSVIDNNTRKRMTTTGACVVALMKLTSCASLSVEST
jgi:hypothetical protein